MGLMLSEFSKLLNQINRRFVMYDDLWCICFVNNSTKFYLKSGKFVFREKFCYNVSGCLNQNAGKHFPK